jgi:type IV secretory pathway TrbD component
MHEAKPGLQHNRIHRALSRPNLLMGADRELVLITGLAASHPDLRGADRLLGALWRAVWIVTVAVLRMMAKADPLMRRVYIRHISYRFAYRPTSAPWRRY